jgi:hypothetical protein
MPSPWDPDRILSVGATRQANGISYLIDVYRVDDVVLPTGQLVACDPFSIDGSTAPLTVTVPPGTYPGRAWIATVESVDIERHKRVAALQLVITDAPVDRWEMALTAGQDLASLSGEQFYGYSVDSGTGTFADLAAVQALSTWDWDEIEEAFFPELHLRVPRLISEPPPESPPPPVVPGARTVVVDESTGANIVTVESGWGDGAYPTFVGYSADGRVACFVTDFLLVPR